MEKLNLNYSSKYIPIPDNLSYQVKFIEKLESVLKIIRYKAHFFLKQSKKQHNFKTTYDFKSRLYLQQHPNLDHFEKEIYDIVKSIKFRKIKDVLQAKIKKCIENKEIT